LRAVLPDSTLPPADLHAVYPAGRHQPAKVRAFIEFLDMHLAPAG
jgi:DNA-binding transcriptional LysR family regulator